jgi:predicted DNA-binding transcriptional regulator AlpA
MDLRLYALDRAPRALPIWQLILSDLGDPPPQRVAKVLGVGTRTVYRWNRDGSAPRAATLALFWLTRWGHSQVNADAVNNAAVAVGLLRSIERERDQLRLQLAHVLAIGEFGAANDPTAAGQPAPDVLAMLAGLRSTPPTST